MEQIKRNKKIGVYSEIFLSEKEIKSLRSHLQNGDIREPYKPLIRSLLNLGVKQLTERVLKADEVQSQEGITFLLNPGEERIIPVDWIPRIIPADHWEKIEKGLAQRLRALNLFLCDTYKGKYPVVPEEIIKTSQYFYPECENLKLPENIYIHLYGPDLVHMGTGRYLVLEDNLRIPSGASYVLKWQKVITHLFPEFLQGYALRPIESFCWKFRENLESSIWNWAKKDPVVVLLTEGSYSPAYYDHKYLAEQMGISLAEPRDLFINEKDEVMMKTNRENLRVHCIYRRVQDLDLFVPGLSQAYICGKVNLANAWGTGVADDKGVFPYVPKMIQYYLKEDPILENAPTYSLADPKERKYVLSQLEKMVVKPREGYGGHDILIGPESSRKTLEDFRNKITAHPQDYIAQDCLDFSAHVRGDFTAEIVLNDAFVDFRAYVLMGGKEGSDIFVWPTGLTRIAQYGTRIVNSSSGGLIKGTWVLR